MDHILKRTYFSREWVTEFLKNFINNKEIVGDDPCEFWRGVKFLKIQRRGRSQTELLALFNELLKDQCGFGIKQCGKNATTFLYLDDGIFTGLRIFRDLKSWVKNKAPKEARLFVVAIAFHSNGYLHTKRDIEKIAADEEKEIEIMWGCAVKLEDRVTPWRKDRTDVLRPTHIPDDGPIQEYVEQMQSLPILRHSGDIGVNALYRSDKGKKLIEREFVKMGARIRERNPKLGRNIGPLGHTPYDKLGFGSPIVTYRNCPNGTPLVLWADYPWHPLFPSRHA